MKTVCLSVALSLVVVIGMNFTHSRADAMVAYPENYREWAHVKTYIVQPKNPAFKVIGGFNHVYANDKAMQGFKTGYFPNGSVIVSDVVKANGDSLNIREGQRDHIDVMARDSLQFSDPGGWRFETFKGDGRDFRLQTPQSRTGCTNCHKKNADFVFAEYRK
jgi:hypothetical protein